VPQVMSSYRAARFFLLRTPLLPYRTLFELGDRDALARAWTSEAIREAVLVASPDLYAALERGDPGATPSFYRYLARMSARSTPFGLFAGVSIGLVGQRTRLRLADQADYRRSTLLDSSYLFLLFQTINADPAFRAVATYLPNSGLYRAGGALRFAETLIEPREGVMSHRLVSVEQDPCVELVLELAREGATLPRLAERLVETCGVSAEEARAYLDDLVDNQLLVSELSLAVTGSEPLQDAITQLGLHPDPALQGALSSVQARLQALDSTALGAPPSTYGQIAQELRALPVQDLEPSRLFRIDLWKPLADGTLGNRVVSELQAVIGRLYDIAPPPPRSELDRLRAAFCRLYGEQWVPLAVATDPELGIFAQETAISSEATGLLEGLTFRPADPEPAALSERDLLLLEKLRAVWRHGRHELVLGDDDLSDLKVEDKPSLPPSFGAWFQLAREEMLFVAAVGPPSSRLLGRFAHGSPRLTELLGELARQEACSEPEALLVEIAHLPEGRTGNVVCRPVLRELELPYLGKSGAPRAQQIPLDDLWLRVDRGRFELYCRTLGRKIVPTLSCAHNTDHNTVPLYRFLAQLQNQDCYSWLTWTWGGLGRSRHLPRVRLGPVIVSREAWVLGRRELEPLGARTPQERHHHVQALREAQQLPRYVSLAEGDNELPIDLEDPVSVEVLADRVRSRPTARLVELWPGPEDAGIEGPEGRYVNELVLPFVRAPAPRAEVQPLRLPEGPPPASEHRSVRVIASRSAVDRVLAALAQECDPWYFAVVPLSGAWQVTLHCRGQAELPALGRALEPLRADGRVQSWSVTMARPEHPPEICAVLAHDSAAALELLSELDGDEELRWQLALGSVAGLLGDLAPGVAERCEVVEELRAARLRALPAGEGIEGELSRLWRARREELERVLSAPPPALVERSRALRRDGALSCAGPALLGRLVQGAAQRLLRGATEAHELVIYDVLRRVYRSERARARLGGSP
jgi:hypothetical protein